MPSKCYHCKQYIMMLGQTIIITSLHWVDSGQLDRQHHLLAEIIWHDTSLFSSIKLWICVKIQFGRESEKLSSIDFEPALSCVLSHKSLDVIVIFVIFTPIISSIIIINNSYHIISQPDSIIQK